MGLTKFIFTLLVPAIANEFLKAKTPGLSLQEVQQAMQDAGERIDAWQEEIRPLFEVLPKSEFGRIEHQTARYALHRYFAHKYGWHVTGLGQSPTPVNASSVIEANHVASYIQGLLEQRQNGQGLELRDLSMFAATLSSLIRMEISNDFEDVFSTLGFASNQMVLPHDVDRLLKTYLIKFMKGVHAKAQSPQEYATMEADLADGLITWFEAVVWVKDLRNTMDLTERTRNPFSKGLPFKDIAKVAEEVGHEFGSFQNLECTTLKGKLVDMEDAGTGRVPLSKFYGGVNDDRDWPFIENTQYLRSLGALDESDPHNPFVVIPNYLGSRSLCVTPSSFYAVCCIDECEGLMANVERAVGAPVASAGRLAEVVAALRSDTVEAPRNLSTLQLTRLADIAAKHDGHIPLHGRLFAQWMHHAYPRECRYPHEAGTTASISQEVWAKDFGSIEVSDEELGEHLRRKPTETVSLPQMPWSSTEELFASHKLNQKSISPVRFLVLLLAFASATFPVARASMKQHGGLHASKPVIHMV